MDLGMASDINNRNFFGAIENPDANLHVQFYTKPVENEFQSALQQSPIFDDVDFIRIAVPGNRLSIIDTYVREEHKKRFPMQWAEYKNRSGESNGVSGTPISEWPRISSSQAEELRALKFYTVESIALASDAQLHHIGMIAGQSAFSFRDDAKRYLLSTDAAKKMREAEEKEKDIESRVRAAEAEVARKDAEFRQQMAEMQAQLLEMQKQTGALLNEKMQNVQMNNAFDKKTEKK